MAERNLLSKYVKFMTKSIFPFSIEKQYLHKSHFENMLSTYMFPPDAALPQVFDETKDRKIMRKNMKDNNTSP